MSSNYPNRSSFHFSLQIESRQCEISWPPFFIVVVWNSLDSCTFSPGSSPRKNFEKISKTDENLAVFAFRAVKRRVKKWTFVATGEGVILDVRASAAWKNMNARERTTKIARKLSDWQPFPFLGQVKLKCEIVWNSKTAKNAYFSKIQNSLKVSEFFPNCSRNNRVSTSKNKGVDFSMTGNRTYMSITLRHTTHEYTLKFMHFWMK